MQIKIVRNTDDFLALEQKWNELFEQGNYSFFQTFNYNYFAFKNILAEDKRNKLNIILILGNEKTVCICPFYSDKYGVLRFINDLHSDFCDILLDNKTLYKKVFLFDKNISSYRFINLKKDSQFFKIFKAKDFRYVYRKNNARFSYLTLLKGDFPINHRSIKSKQKTEFRRVIKKNSSSKHVILSSKYEKFPLGEITQLKNEMIKLRYRNKYYLNSGFIGLIKKLYEKNELIISKVSKNGKTQALSFILIKNNQYLFWIDMFDSSKMINIFNYISLITKLSLIDNIEIHFGRGDYAYKIKNFLPVVDDLIFIHAFQNKFSELKFLVLRSLINILKPIYKKFIK
tara:strand:+ start:1815 stop:2843 length:1029 start_codon:yes stop_codon:yes gene_type:complete